jgi:hypothetical protein
VASHTLITTTVTRVSITEDAAVRPPHDSSASAVATVAWWWLVAASLLVLFAAGAVLAVWWVASRETRTTSYRVLGDLAGVRLDLGDADVEIDGGAGAVEVRRVDQFAFGRSSSEERSVDAGTLSVVSRCPDQVLGSCRTSYRVAVPDNVPIEIQTSSGTVNLAGVRASVQVDSGSGDVSASGYCGFSLRVSSDSGDVGVTSECSADRLELRSRSGDVDAVVPAGRYSIDAQSDSGSTRVRGLTAAEDAPFAIQALSTTGDVSVAAAS